MKKDMFDDCVKALKRGNEFALAKLTLKYAIGHQPTMLGKQFPEYYHTAKTGRVTAIPERKSCMTDLGTLTSVATPLARKVIRIAPNKKAKGSGKEKDGIVKKTVLLGGYGHEAAALRECQQFRHPNVFIYQSAIFPEPRTHGVHVAVLSAKPVKLTSPISKLYPWGVELTMEVAGPDGKAEAWCSRFDDRIRMQVIK